jgi:hypothetical protein
MPYLLNVSDKFLLVLFVHQLVTHLLFIFDFQVLSKSLKQRNNKIYKLLCKLNQVGLGTIQSPLASLLIKNLGIKFA